MRSFAFVIALFVTLGACRAAAASERLAVFILVDADSNLADNLTEVAIAKVAETPGFELVGARELRSRLVEIAKDGDVGQCLARPECLSKVGVAARVGRAIIGNVHREGQTFQVRFGLANTRSGAREVEVSLAVPLDVARLVSAVQESVDELFKPRSPFGPPLAAPSLGRALARELPLPKVVDRAPDTNGETRPPNAWARVEQGQKPSTASPVRYVAYGSAVASVVSFSAAAVTGALATAAPTGGSRAEAQRDLERRKEYATAANWLWAAGGVLSAVGVVTLVWQW